ncbi:ABC transporter substrate-binding protein [Tessaracoccus antarcticus]|uniref:ABC transporter substrate-binding protein n=1 Tax=Tessaracoccus antarcticus TaxID=2479848 RepID=A0A3M0GBF9_9ACTN|nr:ABC transporter substrate-binding protein [Tessaracoccus antarcticus]RMB58873.1 ABC transporter substrate-binding protein [Tessaracoccus antarcticus]
MAAGAVALTACTRPEAPSQGEPVILNIGATGEPVGLDPSTVNGAGTPFVLLYNVYETLVRIDGEGAIRPLLARDYSVSDDNKVYTFNLDGLAKFASNTPVDAEAVVTSFDRILKGDGITDQVTSKMAPVDSVKALDSDTVEVTLKQPSNQWLFDMAGPAGIIYDPAGLDTLDTKPAGSGPFAFAEWETGQFVKLVRNDHYWGTGTRVDEVFFRYYADPNAMNTAMLSGQLDIISNLTVPQALDQFGDPDKYTVIEGTTDGEVVLGFNHDNPQLADLKVRQAINYGIDRQALVDSVWGGKGMLIGSMVAPTDPWFEDLSKTYTFDQEKARALLKEAGFESGLTLRLRVPTLPYAPPAARFIAAQLKEIGVTVQVEELEFARWLSEVYTAGDYDMTIVAHVEPRDIGNFANPDYYWHYDNPAFADLIKKADEGSAQEQVTLMKEAAKMLADDAAADWLFLLPNLVITTKEVSGLEQNATSLSFDLTSVATNR